MPHSYQSWEMENQCLYSPWGMGYHEEAKQFPLLTDLDDTPKYLPPPEMCAEPLSAIGKTSLMDAFIGKWDDNKPIRQWTHDDVFEWICEEARKNNYELEVLNLHHFRVDGNTLLRWSEHDFVKKDSNYGYVLFQAIQRRKAFEDGPQRIKREDENLPPFDIIRPVLPEEPVYTDLNQYRQNVHSDVDSDHSDNSTTETKVAKMDVFKKPIGRPRKAGRPKRNNKEKKCGRLWEFIRDLLLKPEYCPSLICWENHDEGVFRFVRSDKVAELWGTIKENPKMTYEKLSRAMRYYYKSKVLQPVLGRRLVYKFGPTAKGWRTSNPNFREPPK